MIIGGCSVTENSSATLARVTGRASKTGSAGVTSDTGETGHLYEQAAHSVSLATPAKQGESTSHHRITSITTSYPASPGIAGQAGGPVARVGSPDIGSESHQAIKENVMISAAIAPKRLPLRAIDRNTLEREYWSQGKTFYQIERRPARSIEKPIESMSLADLIATQADEPLSESRRSWLQTGHGLLSLDQTTADGGCLADMAEHDAVRFGTPYSTLDPITEKQIAYERRVSQNGPVITAKVQPDRRLTTDRFMPRKEFLRLAQAIRFTYQLSGEGSPRYTLSPAAFREAKRRTAATLRAAERDHSEMAPRLWHSAYEAPVRAHAQTGEGEWIGVTVSKVINRGHSLNTWHGQLRDTDETTLGTVGLESRPLIGQAG
jgi:hypothetical protein